MFEAAYAGDDIGHSGALAGMIVITLAGGAFARLVAVVQARRGHGPVEHRDPAAVPGHADDCRGDQA